MDVRGLSLVGACGRNIGRRFPGSALLFNRRSPKICRSERPDGTEGGAARGPCDRGAQVLDVIEAQPRRGFGPPKGRRARTGYCRRRASKVFVGNAALINAPPILILDEATSCSTRLTRGEGAGPPVEVMRGRAPTTFVDRPTRGGDRSSTRRILLPGRTAASSRPAIRRAVPPTGGAGKCRPSSAALNSFLRRKEAARELARRSRCRRDVRQSRSIHLMRSEGCST